MTVGELRALLANVPNDLEVKTSTNELRKTGVVDDYVWCTEGPRRVFFILRDRDGDDLL